MCINALIAEVEIHFAVDDSVVVIKSMIFRTNYHSTSYANPYLHYCANVSKLVTKCSKPTCGHAFSPFFPRVQAKLKTSVFLKEYFLDLLQRSPRQGMIYEK